MVAAKDMVAQGSESNGNIMNIMNQSPTSPTSASLGKYGDLPVTESVGIPTIDIPIYEIKAGNITLPISLSYHASGIKVDEMASWVGLGWSLNAGGVITRAVKGLPDDKQPWKGYLFQSDYINDSIPQNAQIEVTSNSPGLGSMYETLRQVIEGEIDFMPDEFFYNALGHTGKFLLEAENMGQSNMSVNTVLIPYEDLEIKCNLGIPTKILSFKMVDASGIIYNFNKVETQTSQHSTSNPIPAMEDLPVDLSWYLSSVSDPKSGLGISFEYEIEQFKTDVNWSHQKDVIINPALGNCFNIGMSQMDISSDIDAPRLKAINFPTGKVVFNAAQSNRQDVYGMSKALDNICVYDNKDNLIKKFKLSTGYFDANDGLSPENFRLRLDKFQQLSIPTNNVIAEYIFEYSQERLPKRGTLKQDLWGYFGRNNDTFPKRLDIIEDGQKYFTLSYETKYPGEVADVAANSLTKITYPTGGSTAIEYENNTYGETGEGDVRIPIIQNVPYTNATTPNTNTYAQPITGNFIISDTGLAKISCFYTRSIIYQTGNGDPIVECIPMGTAALYRNGSHFHTFQPGEYYLRMPPGTYNFSSNITQEHCEKALLRVNLDFGKIIGYNDFARGPGLRVRQLSDIDPYTPANNKTTEYTYNYDSLPGKSSGKLLSLPMPMFEQSSYSSQLGSSCSWYRIYNSYLNPISSHQGGYIVYEEVIKKIAGANSGKIINRYSARHFANSVKFPEIPPYNESYMRGLPTETLVIDENNYLKEKRAFTYGKDRIKRVKGAVALICHYNYTHINPVGHHYLVSTYAIPTARVLKKSESVIEYFDYGNQRTQSTTYSYNNIAQMIPSLMKTTFQDGSTESKVVQYARDYVIPSTTSDQELLAIKSLQTDRMFDSPIETYVTREKNNVSKIVSGNYYEYLSNSGGALSKIFSLNLSEPLTSYFPAVVSGNSMFKDSHYEEEASFSKFSLGRPAVMRQKGGKVMTKLYNGTDPKEVSVLVSGADLSEIAYADFDGGKTGWSYTPSGVTATGSFTGSNSYNLTVDGIIATVPAGSYHICYWSNSGAKSINGQGPISTGDLHNGWRLYKHLVSTTGNVTLSGNGLVDDIRLYPENASMETFTYKPLVGLTSRSDASNIVTFYEYDAVGRLSAVKDADGNIIQESSYQYQTSQ